jgi:hypothetical protein
MQRTGEVYSDWIANVIAVEPPEGDFGELLAIRFYPVTPLTSKFLVVAYREVSPDDGFTITAYLTNRPSTKRITIWKQ